MKYNIKQILAMFVVATIALAAGWMLSKFFPEWAYWIGAVVGPIAYLLGKFQLKIIK